MTKVLWLVNPLHYEATDLKFPQYIQQVTNCSLHCIFLSDNRLESIPVFSGDPMFPAVDFSLMNAGAMDEVNKALDKKANEFMDLCMQKGLIVSFHHDASEPEKEVILESRFADLILVKSSLSFNVADEETPTHFVKVILSKAECPVLIMPDEMQTIEEVYFSYNGGYSSVYAMRQFAYLFPELRSLPVTVVFVDENKEPTAIHHQKELKEWLHAHFDNFSFRIIRGQAESELLNEFFHKKNIIATYGAFGRSNLSRFFKRGSADEVLRMVNIPLFITHP